MNVPAVVPRSRWSGAWLDLLACAGGLALAWTFAWTTTDLIWSLWLSSLVVGYALILWLVTAPLRELVTGMAADRANVPVVAGTGVVIALVIGTLFTLAFFTVHFGGFHFVHSAFLNQFFPLTPDGPQAGGAHARAASGMPSWSLYAEVVRRYWWFVPAAALAEREAFRRPPASAQTTAVTPDAIRARQAKGAMMMEPYKNVIRLHLLIFFFAFAQVAHLANFAVYAVAYLVYFFPWRVLKASRADA